MLTISTDTSAREEVHGETGNEDAITKFEPGISLNTSCFLRAQAVPSRIDSDTYRI